MTTLEPDKIFNEMLGGFRPLNDQAVSYIEENYKETIDACIPLFFVKTEEEEKKLIENIIGLFHSLIYISEALYYLPPKQKRLIKKISNKSKDLVNLMIELPPDVRSRVQGVPWRFKASQLKSPEFDHAADRHREILSEAVIRDDDRVLTSPSRSNRSLRWDGPQGELVLRDGDFLFELAEFARNVDYLALLLKANETGGRPRANYVELARICLGFWQDMTDRPATHKKDKAPGMGAGENYVNRASEFTRLVMIRFIPGCTDAQVETSLKNAIRALRKEGLVKP